MGRKIGLLADVHLTKHPPANCTDVYLPDLLNLLEQAFEAFRVRGAEAAIIAGDLFHHKAPTRTDHALVREIAERVRVLPYPVWVLPGNHDMCVSDDTEALTSRGWLRRDQLDGTELFATLNPRTHEFEWEAPKRLYVSSRFEEMVHFKGTRVDHLVTPGHDVYVTTPRGSTSRRQDGSMPPCRSVLFEPGTMTKRKAAEAPGYPQRWYGLTAAPAWQGKYPGFVDVLMPGGRVPRAPSGAVARLFGWYVSEGSCEKGRVVLSQSKTANPGNYEEIVALVRGLGYSPQLGSKTVRIGSGSLAELLSREFGRVSREKRIPRWVKDWPREQLSQLLEAALKGDGSRNGHSSWTYTSNSEQLIDDLQEVCVKLGVRSIKHGPIPTVHRDYPGSPGVIFRLGISYGAPVSMPVPSKVPYAGVVWCPVLENGLWMTRRNGRTLWTGNSHDRIDSVSQTQPLGVLFGTGVLHCLDGWMGGNLPVFGVPWQQHWSADRIAECLRPWGEQLFGSTLIVTHAPLYPPGSEPRYPDAEVTPASWWASALADGSVQHSVFYGHIHESHGAWWLNKVLFCNYGALSRGSLGEDNLTRDIGVTVWDEGSLAFEFVPLNARPADQVFRLAEHEKETAAQLSLDGFLTQLGTTTLERVSPESVMAHVASLPDVPADVAARVEELLHWANAGGGRK